jgi:hypothetical protein
MIDLLYKQALIINCIFLAMNYRVEVYTLDTIDSPFKDPVRTLASPDARRTGGLSESVIPKCKRTKIRH